MAESKRDSFKRKWSAAFDAALSSDIWGQVVEAISGYEKIANNMDREKNQLDLSTEEKSYISRLQTCLRLRCTYLRQTPDQECGEYDLETVKLLSKAFQYLFTVNASTFVFPGFNDSIAMELSTEPTPNIEPALPGTVSIRIQYVDIKDAGQFVDPFISICVRNIEGMDMLASIKTPTLSSRYKTDTRLVFDFQCHLQLSPERMFQSAIFFGLWHFKPRKNRDSLKCFALLERRELMAIEKPGTEVALELYKKPIDYKRKKLSLLTSKPMFLHAIVTVRNE